MSKKKIVVLASGGIDSTVLMADYLNKDFIVTPYFIDYGQEWIREKNALISVCTHYKLVPVIERISTLPLLKKGFVPMRNAILLSRAIIYALVEKIPFVAIGVNNGEHIDQSPEFIDRFNFTLDMCIEDSHPYVLAPFTALTKIKIIKLGIKNKVPLHLTISCLSTPPCGDCYTCKIRKKYEIQEKA